MNTLSSDTYYILYAYWVTAKTLFNDAETFMKRIEKIVGDQSRLEDAILDNYIGTDKDSFNDLLTKSGFSIDWTGESTKTDNNKGDS